jgi:branched-chain amino acid transport system substrate-binding protein
MEGRTNMIDRNRFLGTTSALLVARGTPALAQTREPYKIGMTWPLTGPLASSGLEYMPGAEVGIAHINRAGGINGHALQLVVEDSQGTPQGGVAAMRKLVQVDGCQAIVTLYTNVVAAQIPLADQLKVPIIGNIQTPGLMSRSQYTYSHAETLPATGALFREYWKNHRFKRIFAFLPNNALGPVFSGIFKSATSAAGSEYGEVMFNYGDNDYRGLVVRAKDFNPDGVMVAAPGGLDDTVIIKQLREAGVNVQLFVPGNFIEEPAWRAGVGSYLEGIVMAGLVIDPKQGKQFTDDYRIKTGRTPSPITAEVYDVIRMLGVAIAKGGYSGDAIAKQLAVLKGVPSVLGGTITMDAEHYSVPETDSLRQVRNGKLLTVK